MSIKINGKTIAVKTPFDSAVVDLVSGLNKQKQVLAQALNDKGVNVTSTDTLDKMAGAVKTLEVLGEKTNLKGTVLYGSNNKNSMFAEDTSYSKILPLTLRRLYAYFNPKSKTFKILKFANDFTYEELSSVTLEDDVIQATSSEHDIFSNADETKIVVRAKTTASSYSYKCYSFNITYGDTVTLEQIGQAVEFDIYNYGSAYAGAVKHDGTKFFSFQSNYKYARVVDFVNGTSTEITHDINESYAFQNSVTCYKVDESGLGVAVYGNGTKGAHKMQFDFENNTVTYLDAVYLPSAKIANRNQNYWYAPYYIADKKILVLLIGNSTQSDISFQEMYFQSPVEFIALNTQTGETILHIAFKNCLQGNQYDDVCSKQADSYFYAKLENGRYLVGAAKRGVVEYDPEINKVYVYGTDTELNDGDFIGQVSMNGKYGMYYSYDQTPILSFDTSVLYSAATTTGQSASFSAYTSYYYRTVIYPQLVWGELYKRNGNEIVRTSIFEPSLYEAGAYAEKDEVAVVDVES